MPKQSVFLAPVSSQVCAVVPCSFLSLISSQFPGGYIYISLFAIPTPRSNPEIPLKSVHGQWKQIGDTGKVTFPTVSIVTAVAFGYISWYTAKASERILFAVSALSTLGVIPYTWLVVRGNDCPSGGRGGSGDQWLGSLTARGRQHLIRAGLITVAFGTALVAMVYGEGPAPHKSRLSLARRLLM